MPEKSGPQMTQMKDTKKTQPAYELDATVDPVAAGLCTLLSLMISARREPGTYKCQSIHADCVEPGLKLAAMLPGYRLTIAPHNTSRELAAFSVKYNGMGGAKG